MYSLKRDQLGLTIIELLVTISIAAILLSLAVPPYQDFIKRNNVEALQHRLSAAFITARSEAATRNLLVTVCASDNPNDAEPDCSASTQGWSSGWIVFADSTANGKPQSDDPGEVILMTFKNETDYKVSVYGDSGSSDPVAAFSFDHRGYSYLDRRAMAVICEPQADTKYNKGFAVERSGRVARSTKGVTGVDQVKFDTHDDSDDDAAATSRALTCQ